MKDLKNAIKHRRMAGAGDLVITISQGNPEEDEKMGDLAPDPDIEKDKQLFSGDPKGLENHPDVKEDVAMMEGKPSENEDQSQDMKLLESMEEDKGYGKMPFVQKARDAMHAKLKGLKGK